jgi:hypothetical protein
MSIEVNTLLNSVDENSIKIESPVENTIEVSNIYPANLIKRSIRADERSLISYLRTEAYSICRTEISYEYIKSVFNKFKHGFVYYKDNKLIAFCIWKVRQYIYLQHNFKQLYIYLVCGRQLDYRVLPRILDDVVHYCRKNLIEYITLEPVNDVLKSYYLKNGFKEKDGIDGTNLLVLDVNNPRMVVKPLRYRIKTRKRMRNRSNTL